MIHFFFFFLYYILFPIWERGVCATLLMREGCRTTYRVPGMELRLPDLYIASTFIYRAISLNWALFLKVDLS